MKKEYLIQLINEGHEIEFEYEKKKYSICYGACEDKEIISFCEFYKESKEVKTIDELLSLKYNGFTVGEILEKIDDKNVWIF